MNIIFDAGGVLFYIVEFRNNIIHRVLSSSGYSSNQIEFALTEVEKFDKEYFGKNKLSNWWDEKKWLKARIDIIFSIIDPHTDNNELKDKLFMISFDSFQYRLYDETISVLSNLSDSHNLYVLSNATATLDWAFDYLDIRKFFEDIIISSYVGYEKPDWRIYKHTLDIIGDITDNCIFVDDRFENVAMARVCGIRSFHLQRESGMTLINFEEYIYDLRK